MKRPTFFNGVVAALALAVLASVGYTVLSPLFGTTQMIKLLVPALGLSYLLFLFSNCSEKVGRVTILTCWAILTALAWSMDLPLASYVLAQVGAIWVTRSLYFYSSIFPALMDLGLNVLSSSIAIWAYWHTTSPFLGIWCFFLVQALFTAIPPVMNRKGGQKHKVQESTKNFQHARTRAEAAIRQLFAQ